MLGGGGALGAFQAGLYEALEEAGVAPDWLAGSSIGALNAALIAGNPPEHRLKRLHEFWNLVAEPATTPGGLSGPTRRAAKAASALRARLLGRPGLYRPHLPRLFVQLSWWGNPSLYDLGPALATICRLIDLDRIHRVGPRLTVNLTDLETGRAVLVDSAKVRLRPEHLIASMGLLPEFPPVEIDGQWLCDGGFSANLPLQAVFEPAPRADLTCIAVDLLGEPGPLVFSVDGMMERSSDLLYANQTRATLALLEAGQAGRIDGVSVRLLLLACDGRGERFSQKIWDFGRHSLAERWRAGYAAADVSWPVWRSGMRRLEVRSKSSASWSRTRLPPEARAAPAGAVSSDAPSQQEQERGGGARVTRVGARGSGLEWSRWSGR